MAEADEKIESTSVVSSTGKVDRLTRTVSMGEPRLDSNPFRSKTLTLMSADHVQWHNWCGAMQQTF